MKTLLLIAALAFPLQFARAESPSLNFLSIASTSSGNLKLAFEHDGQRLELLDDDGVATLAVVHFMLTQSVQHDLQDEKIKWATLSKQSVANWSIVKNLIDGSLTRYLTYEEKSKPKSQAAELKAIADSIQAIKKLGDRAPTFEELNSALGTLLETYARERTYTVQYSDAGGDEKPRRRSIELSQGESGNDIGLAMSTHLFVLPPKDRPMSKWRSFFKGDLKQIVSNFERAR